MKNQPKKLFILSQYLNNVNFAFAQNSKGHQEFKKKKKKVILLSKNTVKLLKATSINWPPKCFLFLFVPLFSVKMFSEK